MQLESETFGADVESMVRAGASYIDAVTSWCVSRGLEPEAGAELAKKHPLIMQRIQMEAECLSLVK